MSTTPLAAAPRALPNWRAASLPLAVAAFAGPAAAVLQSRAMAPLVPVCLLLTVIAHWRNHGALPWPGIGRGGPVLGVALALFAWGLASALWSPSPSRSVLAAAQFGGLALGAAAAARAVAADTAAGRALLARALVIGLALGLALALTDQASGHAVRMAVRGLREAPDSIAFGLKPAASVMALLLPLVLLAPMPARARWGLLAAGLAALIALPGRTAAIAAVAGALVAGLAMLWPARSALGRAVTGAFFAALILLAPPFVASISRADVAARMNPSAVHRLLIWDFVLDRASDRPWLGWGVEASRSVPGGKAPPTQAVLDRLQLGPAMRQWLDRPEVEVLPLHPHSGPLQLLLELGWVGLATAAALAGLLAFVAGPVGLGVLASALVTFLFSFGVWQPWWMAAQALALAVAAGLRAHDVPRGPPNRAADGTPPG